MTDQTQDQDLELNENEEVVEAAHDTKNAESQSVASVDAAAGKTGSAKKRKGDKANAEKADTFTPGDPDKTTSKVRDAGAQPKESYDFADDLDALISEEATLSEGFKGKAAIIFEAAINSKIAAEIDRLEEQYAEQMEETLTEEKTALVEKVDSYLNYVVETWMEDNQLAIQNGLRNEIAENFMSQLKDLFVESHIEVPEEKVDLVDDLSEHVEELEEALNKEVESHIAIKQALETLQRKDILREASKELADTQATKLEDLAEGVEFESVEKFTAKITTLKESYFAEAKTSAVTMESEEIDDESGEVQEVSESMSQYLTALRRTNK
jgi:hypothetical protein